MQHQVDAVERRLNRCMWTAFCLPQWMGEAEDAIKVVAELVAQVKCFQV
jgi:hypothetical protein